MLNICTKCGYVHIEMIVMPLKTSDEKQDLILKVFDYFEAESKLSLGESEMNI
jgi:hypothetical protein